jgi:hypothetical protein
MTILNGAADKEFSVFIITPVIAEEKAQFFFEENALQNYQNILRSQVSVNFSLFS